MRNIKKNKISGETNHCILYLSGEQTLSKTLMWILLYLAKEQECQKKIYNEIKKNTVDPKDFVHFDNKEMFPYTSRSFIMTADLNYNPRQYLFSIPSFILCFSWYSHTALISDLHKQVHYSSKLF